MRALVMSGGSSKAAYAVGCIEYLIGDCKINYEAYLGVSAGGINAAYLSMFQSGEEIKAALSLKNLWLSLDNSKIYKHWYPFRFLHAIWQNSLYDSSPMRDLIRSKLDLKKIQSSGKICSVGATNLDSGKYTTFNHTSDIFIDAVLAGASFPVAFQSININGSNFSDGGLKTLSPLTAAIDLGCDEIDLIVTHPTLRVNKFIPNPNIFDIFMRSLDLATDKIMDNDIKKILMYNELAKAGLSNKKYIKLNIYQPDTNLIEDLLDFSPHKIKEMMKRGYNDTKNHIII